MRVFLTQRLDDDEKLHTQLERVETELVAAQKAITDGERLLKEKDEEIEVAKAEARWMGEEKEAAKAKCKDAEHERDQLKKELGGTSGSFRVLEKRARGAPGQVHR